jgi:hypothetical protein
MKKIKMFDDYTNTTNIDEDIERYSSYLQAYSNTGCGGVPCTQNAGCRHTLKKANQKTFSKVY